MTVLMDGKKLSEIIREELKIKIQKLSEAKRIKPVLATILVGDDPASATYVKMKGKACESIGMGSRKVELPSGTSTDSLLKVIDDLNKDETIYGILLQHPVPEQIDERKCFDRIVSEKDVDGVTSAGFGKLSLGIPCFPACTPAGMIRLLEEYQIELAGKHAVVVGRSSILGKPMAMMLLDKNCTVTVCHSRTKNLSEILHTADIVVGALGKPEYIKGEWLKEGVVVLDAGYNPGNVGDVHFESASKKASFITPVPGGVGPMTITMLLSHTVKAALEKNKV
ncbi:MAG: bifunctional methylenetetrahydrofolate dehydrogenase/methenyltetrahydrofolate cyclohydrolase [Spirochaetia bacterium]|nr:bifunctional methylenetetrahydrofolate dehydrogenase/methenyltetrahydrofolate cyclohydrolase [Spirochaetia bacterium]